MCKRTVEVEGRGVLVGDYMKVAYLQAAGHGSAAGLL